MGAVGRVSGVGVGSGVALAATGVGVGVGSSPMAGEAPARTTARTTAGTQAKNHADGAFPRCVPDEALMVSLASW